MPNKVYRSALFTVPALAILLACIWIHPSFKNYTEIIKERGRPVLPQAILFTERAREPSKTSFQFLGGEQRGGIISANPPAVHSLNHDWSSPMLNLDLHTASKASPAVDFSGVYVGSDTGWFRKYDFSGKNLWSFHVSTLGRGIHGTAALTGDTVYFGAYNGWFYALDKDTGSPRWAISLGKAIGASPLISENDLYITVETERDGFIAKLRPNDGHVFWVSEWLGQQAHSSVTLDKAQHLAIVGTNAKSVVAVASESGKIRWTFKTAAENKGTGALIDGMYLFGSTDGTVYALDALSGNKEWSLRLDGRTIGNVAIDPKNRLGVISTASGLYAFQIKDGKRLWSHPYPHGTIENVGRQTAAIISDGTTNAILAQCEERFICIFSEKTGVIERKFQMRGFYSGTPIIYGGHLYTSQEHEGLESFSIR